MIARRLAEYDYVKVEELEDVRADVFVRWDDAKTQVLLINAQEAQQAEEEAFEQLLETREEEEKGRMEEE